MKYKPTEFMLHTSHYDKKLADRAVTFITNLKHTKGKWAGEKFELLPWQEQIVRDIFGIVKENGKRQFLSAYVEIPQKNGNNELVINEEQAEIVRRIYAMYIDGMGMEAISKQLNSEGIPSYKNRKWTSTSIRDILKNEKYKGDFKLQKFYCIEPNKKVRNKGDITSYYIEDDHQPIVSRNDWDKVQQIIAERRVVKNIGCGDTGKYQNRYPLSGLLICPYCGSNLKRKQVYNKRIEWWCSKSIKEGVKTCKGIHISDEDAMRHNITEPTIVKEMIVNGKKCYSYTRKSEYDINGEKKQQGAQKGQNGSVLPSVNRYRRTAIKL